MTLKTRKTIIQIYRTLLVISVVSAVPMIINAIQEMVASYGSLYEGTQWWFRENRNKVIWCSFSLLFGWATIVGLYYYKPWSRLTSIVFAIGAIIWNAIQGRAEWLYFKACCEYEKSLPPTSHVDWNPPPRCPGDRLIIIVILLGLIYLFLQRDTKLILTGKGKINNVPAREISIWAWLSIASLYALGAAQPQFMGSEILIYCAFAFIFGVIGFVRIYRNPSTLKGRILALIGAGLGLI